MFWESNCFWEGDQSWSRNHKKKLQRLATWQSLWTPTSLKDIDKGLTHTPKLFLQEAESHQMKTADQNHVDPRPVTVRGLPMPEPLPWYQPIWEFNQSENSTSLRIVHKLFMLPAAPSPTLPLKPLSPNQPLGDGLRALAYHLPRLLTSWINLLFLSNQQNNTTANKKTMQKPPQNCN